MEFYKPLEMENALIEAGINAKIAKTAVNEYFQKADESYAYRKVKRNQFEKIINYAGRLELSCIKEKIKKENLERIVKPKKELILNEDLKGDALIIGATIIGIGSLFLDAYITEKASTYLNLHGILQALPFMTSFALTKILPLGIVFGRMDYKKKIDSLLKSQKI